MNTTQTQLRIRVNSAPLSTAELLARALITTILPGDYLPVGPEFEGTPDVELFQNYVEVRLDGEFFRAYLGVQFTELAMWLWERYRKERTLEIAAEIEGESPEFAWLFEKRLWKKVFTPLLGAVELEGALLYGTPRDVQESACNLNTWRRMWEFREEMEHAAPRGTPPKWWSLASDFLEPHRELLSGRAQFISYASTELKLAIASATDSELFLELLPSLPFVSVEEEGKILVFHEDREGLAPEAWSFLGDVGEFESADSHDATLMITSRGSSDNPHWEVWQVKNLGFNYDRLDVELQTGTFAGIEVLGAEFDPGLDNELNFIATRSLEDALTVARELLRRSREGDPAVA